MRLPARLFVAACALTLAACASPTPTAAPTATALPALPTATLPPTDVPTATDIPATATALPPTDTPEPTATATPALQPITAANVAGLARTGVIEIPRQPTLLTDQYLSSLRAAYTADSQHILLLTDAGVDVLAAESLEPVAHHPGLTLLSALSDGRFAALQNGALVFVDPLSGAAEAVAVAADFALPFAVSPTGTQAASLLDEKNLRLFDLTSGAATDLALDTAGGYTAWGLFYAPTGANLLVGFTGNSHRYDVYDTASAAKLFDYDSYTEPDFSTDGQYVIGQTSSDAFVLALATGETINTVSMGYLIERGCDATTCIDHGAHMLTYFLAAGPENAIAFWQEELGTNPVNDPWTAEDYVVTPMTYIQDFTTGEQKFVFSGYRWEELLQGLGAPDGLSFVLFKSTGEAFLHDTATGELLAQSDRYTLGDAPAFSPDGALVGWANLTGVYAYDWQNATMVLEQPQPHPVSLVSFVGLLPDGRLLAENTAVAGSSLDVWDTASGTVADTVPGVTGCRADAVGLYILCTLTSSGATRILALADRDTILFSTNDLNLTVLSPVGDSYATCVLDSGSITYKSYAAGSKTLPYPCQPMFYSPDGQVLVLQSGAVIDLASGELALTLAADESGRAFTPAAPAAYFSPEFIVVDNRVFDATTGSLLAELPLSGAAGFVLSDDGLTLNVLTPQGVEQWQVSE